MTDRVAVVTPQRERQVSARAWGPLLEGRAELQLCASPAEREVGAADLVVVDESCPELDVWIARETEGGRRPESIVVFGGDDTLGRGAVRWGKEGTDVLATISDILDRRQVLHEAEEFLEDLRGSNDRLDEARRRFARLVLEQADALSGANRSLTREIDSLTKLQSLARFFAAPGPDDSFGDRLAELAGTVLGAAGAGLVRRGDGGWSWEGRWRLSQRNADGMLPADGEDATLIVSRPSTRKATRGWWLPVESDTPSHELRHGLVILLPEDATPHGDLGADFLTAVRALLAEGLAARATTEALLSRKSQSERILQTLRGGLLKIDRDGDVVLANPACADILETTLEELEGRPLAEAFPRDAHLREILDSVTARTGAIDEVETYLTTARGRRVSISVRASAAPESGRGGREILVLLSDLSRRKAVEEEVRKSDRLAALGRLSAGVAHEIRNPLAGIRTTAEILRNRIEDREELHQFVDVILEETGRLDRIVASLLQFAKPPEPRLEALHVGPVLERARQLAAGRAAESGVQIRIEKPERVPSPLADRDQILQVLLNLLLNGIEATPEGGDVRVLAESTPGSGEVRIIVKDGGDGISPRVRERIFDPFFTTKPGGTGLGLSISRNIVRRHGGQLTIENGEDGAARAVVTLPLPPADRKTATGGRAWPRS